jgi:predicted Zn-dependent protease
MMSNEIETKRRWQMILTQDEARRILKKALSMTRAGNASAFLGGNDNGNIRFARNQVTTSGTRNNVSLSMSVAFGKQVGSASTNQLDDASLRKVVTKAEEVARVSPENPEYMPPLGPSQVGRYEESYGWDQATANLTPMYRARAAEASIQACERENLVGAGFLQHSAGFAAFMNSRDLFVYNRSTGVNYSLTARTEDERGSGWAGREYHASKQFNVGEVASVAAQRGKTTADARALEPGKYTVILDPSCVVDIVASMVFSLNARNADEGRSWVSEKGGGTKLGRQIFPEHVTIYSDPSNRELPGSKWGEDGLAQRKTMIIEKGTLRNLFYSRYWAEKQGKAPLPFPSNIIMEGGSASLEDMVASTKRGVLLSSLWYIRSVDPQSLLLTGLTRDGNYYIEDGKIAYPIKNFRWNESPVAVLKNIEMMGTSARSLGRETGVSAFVPAMKVKEFTFSSLSEAI